MFRNLNAAALGIRATISEIVELALAAHFEGIDFNIPEVIALTDAHGIEYTRSIFESAPIRPGAWPLPTNWQDTDEAFEKELSRLDNQAAIAKELGALRTFTTVPPASNDRPFHENFEWHRERFGRIAAVLAQHGVALGLEFSGAKKAREGKQHEFIHTMDAMLQLCDAIGTGNVGLLFDTWQWYVSGGTLDAVGALKPEQVIAVHVSDADASVPRDEQSDSDRNLPGETGEIDAAEMLKILGQIGYDGPVTPDPSPRRARQMSREQAARRAGEAMRELWRRADLVSEEPVEAAESEG